jgi:hypothetical protein
VPIERIAELRLPPLAHPVLQEQIQDFGVENFDRRHALGGRESAADSYDREPSGGPAAALAVVIEHNGSGQSGQ